MKISPLITGILLLTFQVVNSQETFNKLKVNSPINRGTIELKNGSSFPFTNLRCNNDTVTFTDLEFESRQFTLDKVLRITKRTHSAVGGSLIGAGSGLLLGAALHSSISALGEIVTFGQVEKDDEYKKRKRNFLISTTLIGAGLGAITGALIQHNKTIFLNQSGPVSFQPVVIAGPTGNLLAGLNMKIILH